MRLTQRCIDIADGDIEKGNLVIGSPLASAVAYRGLGRCLLGDPEWISDFDETLSLSRQAGDPMVHAVSLLYKYAVGLPNGCLMADDADLRKTGEALALAERYGDDFAVTSAKFARGLVLAHIRGPQCAEALDLLAYAAEAARR